MTLPVTNTGYSPWTNFQRIAFRFFFLYFFIQTVPLDWKFYRLLFSIDWTALHYGDIFNLAHYSPQFFPGGPTYADWGLVALIALLGAGAWTWLDKDRSKEYTGLYYWLRVLLRYRLAIAIIAYGFIKLYPLQAPYPSISNLNTSYGDFNRWKLFSLSLGIVPSYESFLGFVEVILGLLLLYRKTASIAAFIIVIFTGNVFVSNIAYEGGEAVYSLYLISIAIFLLVFDGQRIIRLLILQKPTSPNRFNPTLALTWQRYGRWVLKTVFILFFVVLYGFKTGAGYVAGNFQFPATKGLAAVSGLYNVREFRINQDTIAYSKTDPVRWQDVVFEKWNTISIRSNRPVIIDSNNADRISPAEKDRNYELEGTGGRHYYSYEADTVNHLLTLRNKNKHYAGETLLLRYKLANDSTLLLSGINQQQDSVFAVLERIDKKYLLEEAARFGRGRRLRL